MLIQPAVPPGLVYLHTPSLRILHMQTFLNGESCSGAYTLDCPFPFALESPFSFMFFTVIPPSTALWGKRDKTYLLFLNGFVHYMPEVTSCQ